MYVGVEGTVVDVAPAELEARSLRSLDAEGSAHAAGTTSPINSLGRHLHETPGDGGEFTRDRSRW